MPDFFMNPDEAKTLAWIYSNKFITTRLFHLKFRPNHSFQTACNDLNRLSIEKGFLKRKSAFKNADSFYYCTRGTIQRLKDLGLVLTSPKVRAPHTNEFSKEHDKRLLQMRMKFEEDPTLPGLTWLSEYEMKIGYRMEWRKLLNQGRGHELKDVRLVKEKNRVPDGFFDVTLNSKPWSFVFEYEHSEYSRWKIDTVFERLQESYRHPIKLVVAKKASRVQFLQKAFGTRVKDEQERAAWWFTDFETFMARPFLYIPWVDLDDYHPALVAPNLGKKSYPKDNSQGKQEDLGL